MKKWISHILQICEKQFFAVNPQPVPGDAACYHNMDITYLNVQCMVSEL